MTIKDPLTDSLIIVLGMNKDNKGSYMLDWQNLELLKILNIGGTNINKFEETLLNRMVSVLTNGKCTNYTQCYRPFEILKNVVNNKDMVFGITNNVEFDFLKLKNMILKNNWNFIVSLININDNINGNFTKLMEIYGIEKSIGDVEYNLGAENLCKDL